MVGVGHSVIKEKEEGQDSSPDLATVETVLDKKKDTEVSEKPQKELQEDPNKGEEGKLLKATVKRVSTRRKTHHIETAEVIFNDQSSDESGDDIPIAPWKLLQHY